MSNKEIQSLLDEIESELRSARTSEEVLATIGKVQAFGKPLVFNHTKHVVIGVICALIGFTFLFAPFIDVTNILGLQTLGHNMRLVLGIISVTIAGALILYIYKARNKVKLLAKMAFDKDAMFDNNLKFESPYRVKDMQGKFSEFLRGNYSQEFPLVVRGEYVGEEHTVHFNYYHFHYVDKRTVTYTTTNSKGRTQIRTKTVYEHHDRYGLLVPFEFVKNIQIFSTGLSNLYPESYSTGSIKFDNKFKIRSAQQLSAAKFLKPAVVVAIEDAANVFANMNIELDTNGLMCLSFTNSNIIQGNQQFDFNNPSAFYQELAGQTKLHYLHKALVFVHHLLKHSDSNF